MVDVIVPCVTTDIQIIAIDVVLEGLIAVRVDHSICLVYSNESAIVDPTRLTACSYHLDNLIDIA